MEIGEGEEGDGRGLKRRSEREAGHAHSCGCA